MQSDRLWVISFAFAVGCGGSDGEPSSGVPSGGANASGFAGFSGAAPLGGVAAGGLPSGGSSTGGAGGDASTGGVSGTQASAGAVGGLSNGGTGGSASMNGGDSAGTSMAGASAASGGRGGRGSGGPNGGAPPNAGAGRGGMPANGGVPASGGMPAGGGTGGCVQNLACKLQPPPSSGDLHQDCVDRINQFRTQCACLPPLQRRMDGEECADRMAEYDAGKNSAHAGWRDKICTPAGAQNSCPGYSSNDQVISLCLQQMWDEGPPPVDPCEDDCFQEYGHFINMTSTSSTKVACGFFTTASGKVWSVQNFSR